MHLTKGKIYGVVFAFNPTVYTFYSAITRPMYIEVGTEVICNTRNGMQIGKIVSCTEEQQMSKCTSCIVDVVSDMYYKTYFDFMNSLKKVEKLGGL